MPASLLLENGRLQTEAIREDERPAASRFITLQMEPCPALDVMARLKALDGVLQATNPQKNEFIVEYNPGVQPNMDPLLMQVIHTHHWQYRHLSHGKTLEEKLFFKD